MAEAHIEFLWDVFQNREGAENIIRQQIEEICEWKTKYFFVVFLVLRHDVNLPFSWKTVVC